MSETYKWQLLQLFGGEGPSGGASCGEGGEAAPGEEGADAGHQRLRQLGVPEGKLRKGKQPKEAPKQAEGRLSWEEIVKDPEYNAQIQKIIRSRVKDQGQNRAILETLEPALKQLAKEHGLDPEHVDHAALVQKITAPKPRQQRPPMERQRFRSHIQGLQHQEQAMRETFPGFDLRQELRNPVFARLTSPAVGLSVEDAFYAVHRQQLQQQSMEAAARKTREMISNAIQSGTQRPQEAGSSSQAPSVSRFDYRSASREQRQALKNEIRKAAAEGRKVYPG